MIGNVARALGNFGRTKIAVLVASVRAAAFVSLTLGSLIGFSVDGASAQTYDFSFTSTFTTSGTPLLFSGVLSGTGCSTSCAVTSLTGTPPTSGLTYNGQYAMALSTGPFEDNLFSASSGVDASGVDFTANGNTWNVEYYGTGPDAPGGENVEVVCFGGTSSPYSNCYGTGLDAQGTLTWSQTSTPAPVPGAGLLSYLVLGFAGLMFGLKSLVSGNCSV
jgi:hypothetical protein